MAPLFAYSHDMYAARVRAGALALMAALTLPKALRWARRQSRPAFLATHFSSSPAQSDLYKDIYKVLLAWWVISKLRRREHAVSWLGGLGLYTIAQELIWNPFTEPIPQFFYGPIVGEEREWGWARTRDA